MGMIQDELKNHWTKLGWWDKVVVAFRWYWIDFVSWLRWVFQRDKYWGNGSKK